MDFFIIYGFSDRVVRSEPLAWTTRSMNTIGWIANADELAPAASFTTLTVNRLRTDIIEGQFAPDEKLRVKALCERFDTNTSAIREALSRLVAEGLVRAEDQRGFYVATISANDLMDLTRTRIQLETLAVTQAIKSGDVAWEASLVAAFHTLSKIKIPSLAAAAENKREWFDAHRTFHRALLAGCGSPTLIALCDNLYAKSERYRHLSGVRRPVSARDVATEHRRILEAALARDADTLVNELSAHFMMTSEHVLVG